VNESHITFLPEGKTIIAAPGTRIIDLARLTGIDIPFTCGGKGTCGRCRVFVRKGMETLGPLSEAERGLLSPEEVTCGVRLGCALWSPVDGDLVIEIPEVQAEQLKIHTEGATIAIELDPTVKQYIIHNPGFKAKNLLSYEQLILDGLKNEHRLEQASFNYKALHELSKRAANHQDEALALTIWNDEEILSIDSHPKDGPYGIAIDIGTTTVVCYLLDLKVGKVISVSSASNSQAIMGDDVMSRIAAVTENQDNLFKLQMAVVESINRLIRDCCDAIGIAPMDIYECCCAGNTCMQHLFIGLSPQALGFFPYRPVIKRGLTVTARCLHPPLLMNLQGKIYLLPSIAGFVGGDNVAVQLIVNHLDSKSDIKLILDIGTNTEMALADSEGVVVCSCPSGPAFEGMHITYGVRGVIGAIERVSVTPGVFEVKYKTIGNNKPVGICGSGLVDAVAGFIQSGILQRNGAFKTDVDTPRLRTNTNGEREFVLAWKEETDIGRDIVIRQRDVVEFQKAKAAIQAAYKILMRKKGITEHQIGKIFIAGAFGQYIDPDNAITTGMLPPVPLEKIETIGNAAGSGARMVLISRKARREAEALAEKSDYLELSADPEFSLQFMQSMFFMSPQ